MSDFQAAGYDRQLSLLAQRHDVIAVAVEDPGERSLPDVGLVRFIDPETGAIVDVDTSAPAVRTAYARRTAEERRPARSCSASWPSTKSSLAPTAAWWNRC